MSGLIASVVTLWRDTIVGVVGGEGGCGIWWVVVAGLWNGRVVRELFCCGMNSYGVYMLLWVSEE